MTKSIFSALIALSALATHASIATAAGDPVRGETLYQTKCAACHSIEYNGVGPAHQGLFERKAGGRTDYTYSPALRQSTVQWNEKTVDQWLTNPEAFIPGQKMGIMVPEVQDRADLIAYLKKETVNK